LAPSERDDFVLKVAQKADGHTAPVIDLVYALATVTDLEHLATRVGKSFSDLNAERRQARRRVEDVLDTDPCVTGQIIRNT
jgi:hypothetical protein